MSDRQLPEDEPCYVISVAAKLVNLHPQTLRYYDKIGLIQPDRTEGRIRLYSPRDIRKLRKIARLTEDLGVNLAGVEVILNMTNRIRELQREVEQVRRESQAEIRALRKMIAELEAKAYTGRRGDQIINVIPTPLESNEEDER